MPRTLLLADAKHSWRDFLEHHPAPLLDLDPARADDATPGWVTLHLPNRTQIRRFIGTLDARRDPLALLEATAALLPQLPENAHVLLFPWSDTPVGRKLSLSIARLIQPERIVAPESAPFLRNPWPVGPEELALPTDLPEIARQAQRRALWHKFLAQSASLALALGPVRLEGTRLGTGHRHPDLHGWAESSGKTLLWITDSKPDQAATAQALRIAEADKAILVHPKDIAGRVAACSREDGEDLAPAVIEFFDLASGHFTLRVPQTFNSPVHVLRIGLLRVDPTGKELTHAEPWSL